MYEPKVDEAVALYLHHGMKRKRIRYGTVRSINSSWVQMEPPYGHNTKGGMIPVPVEQIIGPDLAAGEVCEMSPNPSGDEWVEVRFGAYIYGWDDMWRPIGMDVRIYSRVRRKPAVPHVKVSGIPELHYVGTCPACGLTQRFADWQLDALVTCPMPECRLKFIVDRPVVGGK